MHPTKPGDKRTFANLSAASMYTMMATRDERKGDMTVPHGKDVTIVPQSPSVAGHIWPYYEVVVANAIRVAGGHILPARSDSD